MKMKMNEAEQLCAQLSALSDGVKMPVTLLANAAALLWQNLDRINWAGFYLYEDGALWLGPFQGKPACTKIGMGKGVCGTAAQRGEVVAVPDVHAFPGHIACDADSASEIVVPLYRGGMLYGVLDIDSPEKNRFSGEIQAALTAFAKILTDYLEQC